MRIRHIGGAVFGLILICVFAYLISDHLPSDRPFKDGKEIADLLIADTRKHNDIASLSIIPRKSVSNLTVRAPGQMSTNFS